MLRRFASVPHSPHALLIAVCVLVLAVIVTLAVASPPYSQPSVADNASLSDQRDDSTPEPSPAATAASRLSNDASRPSGPASDRNDSPGTEPEAAKGKTATGPTTLPHKPKPYFETVAVSISGTVEDEAGAGIADVEVFVHRPVGKDWRLSIEQTTAATRTGADGSFQFEIEVRYVMQNQAVGLDIWPIKSGMASEGPIELRGLVGGGPGYNVRIVLVSAGSVYGRVVDTAGTPLAGATVTATSVVSGRRPHLGTRVPVATDAGGNYQIDALAPGTWEINARLDGYDPSDGAVVRVEAGKHCSAPTVTLTKNTWITMRLLQSNGIEVAVTEAIVRIEFRTATGRDSWTEIPAKVSAGGELKVQVFLYTPTSLTVHLAGYQESQRISLQIKEGEVNDVGEVELSPKE